MQFKIGKLVITIVAVDESDGARRRMARRVDEVARGRLDDNGGSWPLVIQRIKAYRDLNDLKPGLKDSKEWVEAAFANNGKGDIL